jgi:hypothetical protein
LYERQELRAGDLEDILETADDDVRIEARSQRPAHLLDGVARANAFLEAWRTFTFPPNDSCPGNWKTKLQTGQGWDTWFICSYAPLFALLCWLASAQFAPTLPELGAAGRALAVAHLLAGALDFLENASINKMIEREMAQTPWPLISTTASGIKWLLIFAFFAYGIGAAVHWLAGPHGRP